MTNKQAIKIAMRVTNLAQVDKLSEKQLKELALLNRLRDSASYKKALYEDHSSANS